MATHVPPDAADGSLDRPPLMRDPSFWGLLVTQFLGAFNDNLFKQLVLFLSVKLALVNRAENLQGVAMFMFAAPFVLLSGVCGVLSDRHSKRSIIILSKVLEIVVMLLGAAAFWSGSLVALMGVLCLMAAQSTLFGPAKYGVLPELFRPEDLPRANGWMLMTTFISIILGVMLAGFLMERLQGHLWTASLVCIVIAIVGTLTTLPLRHTPVAHPGLKITPAVLFVPPEARVLLRQDRTIFVTLIVASIFWYVGGIYHQGVNDLGILQLRIGEYATGVLGGCAAIGIAIGSVAAGKLSRGRFEAPLVIAGMWGMLITLLLLALPGPMTGGTLLGTTGAGVVLVILGTSAGLFAVPVTVYLQARTPDQQKGQIIGVMNLFNWIGILLSALIHLTTSQVLARTDLPANLVFLAGVLILVPLVIWYRPVSASLGRDAVPPAELL